MEATNKPNGPLLELKKKPEADLTKKSGLFFNIGLVIALGLCITAFEWKFYDDNKAVSLGAVDAEFEDVLEIPPTEQPPPPPPSIQQPEIIEVPDEEEIEEDIEMDFKVDMDETTKVADLPIDAGEEEVEEIFTIVEDQPTFPGGEAALYKYIGKNIKYPEQAKRMGTEGKVFIQFVVDKDGSVTDVTVLKGIGGGCDEEAVRVVKSLPKYKPGKQRGRPVRVKMSIPIFFKLN